MGILEEVVCCNNNNDAHSPHHPHIPRILSTTTGGRLGDEDTRRLLAKMPGMQL